MGQIKFSIIFSGGVGSITVSIDYVGTGTGSPSYTQTFTADTNQTLDLLAGLYDLTLSGSAPSLPQGNILFALNGDTDKFINPPPLKGVPFQNYDDTFRVTA